MPNRSGAEVAVTRDLPVEQLFEFVSVRPPRPARPEPRILDNVIPDDVDPDAAL